jgi:MFS family permease
MVDRYQAENLYFGAVLIGAIFVFVMAMGSNFLLIISAVLYAFFYFSTQPIQNFIIARYLPEHRRGLGYGIHFFLTFGVGSTAATVSGYLADHFGLQSVFYAMGFCFILASCLSGFLATRASGRIKHSAEKVSG